MATCPQTTRTEQVLAQFKLGIVTVRVVHETPEIFPYGIYVSHGKGKAARIDGFVQLPDALRKATDEFLLQTTHLR